MRGWSISNCSGFIWPRPGKACFGSIAPLPNQIDRLKPELADFLDAKVQFAGMPDELETLRILRPEQPVPAFGTGERPDEADVLIIANGLDLGGGDLRELSDGTSGQDDSPGISSDWRFYVKAEKPIQRAVTGPPLRMPEGART
jgi:hypothetical protein